MFLLITLVTVCYLLWLSGKLWRLSQRKKRVIRATINRPRRPLPIKRSGRRKDRRK
ncbi:high mobility group protein Z [Affinibrenneria salicis]|uniref:High mobility group protein Z n=1 Tax=Affinibrenneria salicis TaxID=2590031 RepID=A0A5J5FW54_9GAMM|nr:high mobility group protein Z [Affinibrenneria salicis]